MSATLFSRDWYRIAELKPELRHHVKVHAHRYRGKRWYVLEDNITGQVRRISAQSYLIVGLMNGNRTVDQLWDISSNRLGEEMPTHEELLQLLSSLYQANLIRMDISGDVGELFERNREATKKRWIAKLKSPLSIKIPLVDPEYFLSATQKYVSPFFTKTFVLIWLTLIITMSVLAGQHWDELTNDISDRVLAADNLLLLWLIYPFIKLLHELGHAYCVKRAGGEVHELGVMLLVFIPMPYVDASASSAFSDKKKRMLVASAGILVELFIAAIAILVWVNAESGLAKSIAYNIIFIAGVSTVLVNGNPLLRFDGYFILADYLEIPNLGQRSNQYWGWLSKRILFGVKGQASPAYDNREALWLFFYGFGALVYRLFLMVTIILFVAQQYFVVGVILAVWALIGTLIWPNLKMIFKLWQDSDILSGSRTPTFMVPIVAGIIIFLLAAIPFPLSTSIEGVVKIDEKRRVLAKENCFIQHLHKQPGEFVHKDDLLVSCENRQLRTEQESIKSQLAEASAQRQGVWDDAVRLKIYDDEINRLKTELIESKQRVQSLKLYAQSSGVWSVRNISDLPGRFLKRGDLVGYVMQNDNITVQGMISEADIEYVRERVTAVYALKAADLYVELKPASWNVFPAVSKQAVSEVLTEAGGGKIKIDPSDSKQQTLEQYFLVSFQFNVLPATHVEERIYLKFEHPPEAIIFRTYRLVRRTFLQYFDV